MHRYSVLLFLVGTVYAAPLAGRALPGAGAPDHMRPCTPTECVSIVANNLTFSCRVSNTTASPAKGTVMLLHGFPEWSSMYTGVMTSLAASGYSSIACDQRGYSPGARPEKETDYNYNTLESDVWAIAHAVGYEKFHLVGHDHGAVLGWKTASSQQGKDRILSYSALSIPHLDAFSAGLFGPDADVDQQVASQYFSMFLMNGSASLDFSAMYHLMGSDFPDANSFQKALWWYSGANQAGVMSFPPLFSATDLLIKYKNPAMAAMRQAYSGCEECKQHQEGWAAAAPVGKVVMPALYVCGKSDSAILCNKPYALKTKDFCEGKYEYLAVDCGHDVTDCKETGAVTEAILRNIAAAEN